jgi:DNA recombination protein RmuC
MFISLTTLVLFIVVAVATGCLLGWLSQRGRVKTQQTSLVELASETRQLRDAVRTSGELASRNETMARLGHDRAEKLEAERDRLSFEKQSAEGRAIAAETHLVEERRQSADKVALLVEAREQLSNQFRSLANDILEDKSARFTEQNQKNIQQVLQPLEAQLSDFRKRVEEAQTASVIQTTELGLHLTQLKNMNSQLSQEASNLARALRASPGAAGRLGDDFLRRVLETAGLQEGLNYHPQRTFKDESGGNLRPDYILDLPGDRHIVIDAKMSLKDYDDYCNAQDEKAREASLAEHLKSVRSHLIGLSAKSYQSLHGLNSLDFVVMFMPIEPAFHLAIAKDANLWNEALGRDVLLVSPSTLLFVVRTVAHLWKQEQQTQNVKEIVKRGGALYDKFVGFVEDLRDVGMRLDQAKIAYDGAYGKLTSGDGNLTRQVEMLRSLGVKPRKTLPPALVAAAKEEEFEEGPLLDFSVPDTPQTADEK